MIDAALFPTPIGTCGIAWTASGIHRLQLPEKSVDHLLRRLHSEFSGFVANEAPPPTIRRVIDRLQRHLEGSGRDAFHDVDLDFGQLPSFSQQVYHRAREVRPGQTVTYAELARRCGNPNSARAIGQAMATNPLPLLIPCHRVLATDGGLGGFSAHGGTGTKLRLLTIEGADLEPLAAAGIRSLRRGDSKLAPVIRRTSRYPLARQQGTDPFTVLAKSIVHQQVSMKAAATIFGRLMELVGASRTLRPGHLLDASEDLLQRAGLSRQKRAYLMDLADKTAGGRLHLAKLKRMDDEQVIQTLVQVKGIGRWSAEMFLMFQLGRLNVLPVDDLGLRKGVQQLYGWRTLPDANRLRRLAERWWPFCSIATWYVWRSLEAGGL